MLRTQRRFLSLPNITSTGMNSDLFAKAPPGGKSGRGAGTAFANAVKDTCAAAMLHPCLSWKRRWCASGDSSTDTRDKFKTSAEIRRFNAAARCTCSTLYPLSNLIFNCSSNS
jgi:hypothetical protein